VAHLAAAFDLPLEWLCHPEISKFELFITRRHYKQQIGRQYEPPIARHENLGAHRQNQTINFCTGADGVSLAYATSGDGPPLVKAGSWLNHLEHDWYCPIRRPLFSWLSEDRKLIRYDPRGTGLSDWNVDEISFDAFERDLETIIEAAGVERFALFGTSQGAGLAANYAARHPERVSHLIMLGSLVSGWPALAVDREAFVAMGPAIERYWGKNNPAFRQTFTSMFIPDASLEEMHWFNEVQRITVSPSNANQILQTIGQMNGWRNLAEIKVPTLVLHARHDAVVRFEEGRRIAKAIPYAQFIPLDSSNHLLLEHEPAFVRFQSEVGRFLRNSGFSK
jgi:pimeloyl-ACP methyl ester carboxylesterase